MHRGTGTGRTVRPASPRAGGRAPRAWPLRAWWPAALTAPTLPSLPSLPHGAAAPVALDAPLRLPDGTVLEPAPLSAGDAEALQAFVAGLSPRARYLRFHAGWPALPALLLQRLVDVDASRHLALAVRTWAEGPLVAEARFVHDAQGPRAEFALAVADAWQGRGLGRALLQRLCQLAQGRGLQVLYGRVLADNGGMRQLVHRVGGQLQRLHDDPGLLLAELPVGPAGESQA